VTSTGGSRANGGRTDRSLRAIAPAIIAIALATTAIPAFATTDRADYASQVDPICVRASAHLEPLLDRRAPKATKRALAILRRELASLRRVAAAPGDQALVSSWLATRKSIRDLVKRDVGLARRLQRLEDKFFSGKADSTRRLKPFIQRIGRMGRTINKIEGRVNTAADTDESLAFTLGAIDCIGSIGAEDFMTG
jgi:hypothetical protein